MEVAVDKYKGFAEVDAPTEENDSIGSEVAGTCHAGANPAGTPGDDASEADSFVSGRESWREDEEAREQCRAKEEEKLREEYARATFTRQRIPKQCAQKVGASSAAGSSASHSGSSSSTPKDKKKVQLNSLTVAFDKYKRFAKVVVAKPSDWEQVAKFFKETLNHSRPR